MATTKEGKLTTTLRFENEKVYKMLLEISEIEDRSQNYMLNKAIKELHKQIKKL